MLLQFLSGTFHHLLLSSVIAKRCRILRRRKRLLPLTTLIVTGFHTAAAVVLDVACC